MKEGSRRGAFLFGVIFINDEKVIGFQVDGYLGSEVKKTKWLDFRDALAFLDWAFFGKTQDLSTGNLYLHGQFYHEKSTIILTKESIVLLEEAIGSNFIGQIENIPLKAN